MAAEMNPKSESDEDKRIRQKRGKGKRRLPTFKPTGNRNYNKKPGQDDGMFTVRLMRAIRHAVKELRHLKHGVGLGLLAIYKRYPNVDRQWVDDIVFYRVWPMMEQEQGVNAHVSDMVSVDVDKIREFSIQIGFVAMEREFTQLLGTKTSYRHYYGWSDEDDIDSNL